MTTPFPAVDLTIDILSDIRELFEQQHLAEINSEDLERNISREFYEYGYRPLSRKVMGLATSRKWGLGTTKTTVARKLGMERTRATDAHLRGDMGLRTYIAIMYGKQRHENVKPDWQDIFGMNRAGFIGVAKYLASFVKHRPGLNPTALDELRYELMCEMIANMGCWSRAELTKDHNFSLALINDIAKTRDVMPGWYTEQETVAAHALVEQLTQNSQAGFEFLSQLYRSWHDIFICAAFQIDEAELRYSSQPHKDDVAIDLDESI